MTIFTEKHVLVGTTVILVAALVWMALHRKDNVVQAGNTTIAPPNYLTVNQPNGNIITGTPTGISLDPLNLPMASGCGCGGSDAQISPTLNNLLTYFNTSIKGAYDQYNNAVLNMLPYYLRQYMTSEPVAQTK